MNEFHNILLEDQKPAFSRSALISFGAGCLSMLGLLAAQLFFPAVFLYLLFPVAIVAGHMGLRRVTREPARYKGRAAALFGLVVGYFGLVLTFVALTVVFG